MRRKRKTGFFTLDNYSRKGKKAFIGLLGWQIVPVCPEERGVPWGQGLSALKQGQS